jgi:hypothetical protein
MRKAPDSRAAAGPGRRLHLSTAKLAAATSIHRSNPHFAKQCLEKDGTFQSIAVQHVLRVTGV